MQVFTVATPEVCKERNSSRPTDEAYSPTTYGTVCAKRPAD